MKFPGFWPEGSKIITNVQNAQHELRTKDIARLQNELKREGLDMPAPIRKAKLADLFKLMEEDEVARGGTFEVEQLLHIPSEEEKDRMYSLESKAANDSVGEADKLA